VSQKIGCQFCGRKLASEFLETTGLGVRDHPRTTQDRTVDFSDTTTAAWRAALDPAGAERA